MLNFLQSFFGMIPNQICLEDSDDILNDHQIELFLNVHKSKSDDSVLGKLIFIGRQETQKRPLLLDFNEPTKQSNKVKVFKKKVKKERKKNFCDYRKNICGYITKKIIRQYISPAFATFVSGLCLKHKCSYEQSKSFYLSRIQRVTGPSHVPSLLNPTCSQQVPLKAAFRQFFAWFLKQRYLRYLMLQGKMENKKAYIEYKNHNLMMLLDENQDSNFGQHPSESRNHKQSDEQNSKGALFQVEQSNEFSGGF